jgi:thiamine pyrophosphate-dependent acetolactate synthase large subunit-like protein
MKMSKAVGTFCEFLGPGELVVSTNGAISRELHAAGHREGNFYMLGSMGQASSIALGVALSQPGRRVVALDGDGSLIMNFGIVATVGELKPANLLHVVLDNGVYNTTGGQPTSASVVDLAKVAKAAGYRSVGIASNRSGLRRAARRMLRGRGPSMLVLKVKPGPNPELSRIMLTPEQIKRQFRRTAIAEIPGKVRILRKKKHRLRK